MIKKLTCICVLAGTLAGAKAQVKVGNNAGSIDPNSVLELESTNKGFLPPRVALTSVTSASPLTAPVPAGMLVYSTGGTLADGYYFWDGSRWQSFNHETNLSLKSSNATLTKSETFVLASGNTTLTLPVVTNANNGLSITVKNVGSYTDLITVKGSASSTIDGESNNLLTRWKSKTFVAYDGNWILKEKDLNVKNIYDVNTSGSWTDLTEILEFLDSHMMGPSVIRLSDGSYPISNTITIDLPYPLTIQGTSFSTATLEASSGLAGSPMFNCVSESYFKMLAFDATTLPSYGSASDEDCIWLNGSGAYHEVKDCDITGFNKGIVNKSDDELWFFECNVNDAVSVGLEMNSTSSDAIVKVSEVDFNNCQIGIKLTAGADEVVSVMNCGFYNGSSGQVGINYVPGTFAPFTSIHMTHNIWNNTGTFMSGFDFSRADGRDANAFIQNNAGMGDQNPNCRINVTNNSTATTCTNSSTWYKANWTNTSSTTTKWGISNNKITYLPSNHKNGWAIITGNIQVSNTNRTITIGLVKNGVTTTRYGETDLRVTNANQPFQFSTVVYLSDIGPNDYFELYCASSSSNDNVTFQDVQWYTETK